MKLAEIRKRGNCYNDGSYYLKLLPMYTWNGLNDEDYLENHLEQIIPNGVDSALELACGTGRGTERLVKFAKNVTVVDKNPGMLSTLGTSIKRNMTVIQLDMKDFIRNAAKSGELAKFDFVFSFWGIFYLANQEFLKVTGKNSLVEHFGDRPYQEAYDIINTFLSGIGNKAKACFMHVRRDTEEQRLNRLAWAKWVNERYNPDFPTPSELILNQALSRLKQKGVLDYCISDVNGVAVYKNMGHALETYLNFHSKAYFNDKPYFYDVLKFIKSGLIKSQQSDGKIIIGAGVKVIDIAYN